MLAVDLDHKQRIDRLLDRAQRRAIINTPTRPSREEDNVFRRTKTLPGATRRRPAANEYLHWDWKGVFEWSARCDEIRMIAGFQDWKGIPLNWLKTLSTAELEELLRVRTLLHCYYGGPSCEDLEPLAPTQPGSSKKLRMLEWSVLKMTLRLLQPFSSQGSVLPKNSSREKPRTSESTSLVSPLNKQTLLAKANYNVYTLRHSPKDSDIYDNFERPHLPNYDWKGDSHDEELLEFNQILHAKLQKLTSRKGLGEVLKLICMDLLNSTIPPNIHAYNLLLVRLCQLKEERLVWIVLDSMDETHVRPNEVTHATLLRYFTTTNDRFAFCCYLDKMSGRRRGLAVADPSLKIHPLVARQFRHFGIRPRRTAVLARKNQEVYSSLLVGMLHFFKPRDAMYWYRAMINEGWRPTAEILIHILSSCCAGLDWEGGVAVWEQFRQEGIQLTSVAYEWMLRLCRNCGREDIFLEVLGEGIRHGALTSNILEVPSDVLLGDVDVLLEKAGNHKRSRGFLDRISVEMRDPLLEFEKAEGRHLIANALQNGAEQRSAARDRLNSLSRLAVQFAALKKARETIRTELQQLSTDIALTTAEIFREVTVPVHLKLRYNVSRTFVEPTEDISMTLVSNAYRRYQRNTVPAGGKYEWEPPEMAKPRPEKGAPTDAHSSKALVNTLDLSWFPQIPTPDPVDEPLAAAVG